MYFSQFHRRTIFCLVRSQLSHITNRERLDCALFPAIQSGHVIWQQYIVVFDKFSVIQVQKSSSLSFSSHFRRRNFVIDFFELIFEGYIKVRRYAGIIDCLNLWNSATDPVRTAYFIKFLVELAELSDLLHDFFPHEKRRVEGREVLLVQDLQRQVDQRLF